MIEVIVGGIVVVVAAVFLNIRKKNEEIRDFKALIEKYIKNYQFEECDKPMIEKCRLYISSRFPGKIEEHFAKCNTESEREQLLYSVAQELISRMGVQVDKVEIVDLGSYTYGQAGKGPEGEVIVQLNKALLYTDPQQLIKTLCHELRHCVQFQSVTNNVWGYSDQRVALWLANMEDYFNPANRTFETYELQPLELDANAFAEAVFS